MKKIKNKTNSRSSIAKEKNTIITGYLIQADRPNGNADFFPKDELIKSVKKFKKSKKSLDIIDGYNGPKCGEITDMDIDDKGIVYTASINKKLDKEMIETTSIGYSIECEIVECPVYGHTVMYDSEAKCKCPAPYVVLRDVKHVGGIMMPKENSEFIEETK